MGHRPTAPPGVRMAVKPFNRQHPVRGYLNDPRGNDFHFGIDISAPTGPLSTPSRGRVVIDYADHALTVWGARGASATAHRAGRS